MIGFGVQSKGYLEGQGDLVSIVIALINHIAALVIPVRTYFLSPLNLNLNLEPWSPKP